MTEDFVWIAAVCALLTYATRIGGYLVLARLQSVPPRLEAALNAVPAAVMTTLFAPVALAGVNEAVTLLVAVLAGLRFGLLPVVGLGVATIIVLRAFG